jgi:hypothetical protein
MDFKCVVVMLSIIFVVVYGFMDRTKRSSCRPCLCTDVYMDCSGLMLDDIPEIDQRVINSVSLVDLSNNRLNYIDVSVLLNFPMLTYVNVRNNPTLCNSICSSNVVKTSFKAGITIETDCVCAEVMKSTESIRELYTTAESELDTTEVYMTSTTEKYTKSSTLRTTTPRGRKSSPKMKPKPKIDIAPTDYMSTEESTEDSTVESTVEPTEIALEQIHTKPIDRKLVFIVILTVITAITFVVIMLALYCCGNCIRMFSICLTTIKIRQKKLKCCKICRKEEKTLQDVRYKFDNLSINDPPCDNRNILIDVPEQSTQSADHEILPLEYIHQERLPLRDIDPFPKVAWWKFGGPRQRSNTKDNKSHPM